ncbi:MAG: ATP-dependent RNA helicase HrpA, partial [Pontiellaceae bacterium]|nr:ATP-dependent RNA helicase HrpA [Pontiellaceae bacterium]
LLLNDRAHLTTLIQRARRRLQDHQPADQQMATLNSVLEQARQRAQKRAAVSLAIQYPENLPISGKRDEIRKLIEAHQVVIVCGTTGSGKTTQLPKIVREAGLGKTGRIGITQPRRLAATGMARRVAEEMQTGYGCGVGCQVRFDDQTGDETVIKFMTDGILLAETRRDRSLLQYDCLIIDEAHERSLNIDFLLGYLKTLLPQRPDLKVIISSATLDVKSFSEFFDNAPVIEIEGRVYPVEDFFLPPGKDEELSNHILRAMRWISDIDDRGDVLIFLPGEREIRDAAKKLEGKQWANTEILPLFGRLSLGEQQRVFTVGGRRRIILATNVAETSITIPGIHYVIDSGLVRLSRYNPRTQVQGLQIEQVSQAGARQRRGRCGRVTDGICIYLYDKETLDGSAPYTDPEIRRTSLAGVILQMNLLGLPLIEEFPFIDPPQTALIREGYKTLQDLGALDDSRRLTQLGRDIAAFPVDPHLARMLVQANKEGTLAEILILVAFLSIQDVRERPAENTDAADLAHKKWQDPRSDFITIINLWNFIEAEQGSGGSHGRLRKLCHQNFINYRRVQEWKNLWHELQEIVHELGWTFSPSAPVDQVNYDLVHRSLLAGLPVNIGVKGETQEYTAARSRSFFIFPGSALFKKPPQWVMAFALVETTRLYARTVAEIDPAWLEQVAPHLCKAVYKRPAWNPDNGFVYAIESIVCGGLTIVDERRVHYGPINPEAAREIFIRDGLVPGNLKTNGGWFKLHRKMLDDIAEQEEKIRRPGSLLDPEAVFRHFDRLLPYDVYSVKTLENWLRKTHTRIAMRPEDAVYSAAEPVSMQKFPDRMVFGDESFPLHYTFAPGDELDGVALICPSDKLTLVPEWAPGWLVPGRLEEKVVHLLRTLPKNLRERIMPLNQTARSFLHTCAGVKDKPLPDALAGFLQEKHRLPVDASDFDETALPADLQMKVIETKGEEIVKIHSTLSDELRHSLQRTGAAAAFAQWERSPKKIWPGDTLPAEVIAGGPQAVKGFPALADEPDGVAVRVFLNRTHANYSHRAGLVRLFRIQRHDQISYLEKRPPLPPMIQLTLSAIDAAFLTDFFDAAIAAALTQNGAIEIRDGETFARCATEARSTLHETAAEMAVVLEELIKQREKVIAALSALPETAREDIEMQLEFLFRPGFLKTQEVFSRYPRYLRALQIRIQRLGSNPESDRKKLAEIEPFQNRLDEKFLRCKEISKACDLIELAMMLEEFRINRFAPEIGTPVKISAKRLEEFFQALEN